MADKILYYYHADKNPSGAFYPGVPLDDLTEDQFNAQPDWIKAAIEDYSVSPYRKTKPQVAKDGGQEAEKSEGNATAKVDEGGAVVEVTLAVPTPLPSGIPAKPFEKGTP